MRLEAPSEGSFCGNIFEIIVLGKGSLKLPQYYGFSRCSFSFLRFDVKNESTFIMKEKFLTITQQKSKEIQTHIHFMSFLFGEHDIQTGDRYYVDSNQ